MTATAPQEWPTRDEFWTAAATMADVPQLIMPPTTSHKSEYQRQWRLLNSYRVAEYGRRQRLDPRVAEREREYGREYRMRHPDEARSYDRNEYRRNAPRRRAYMLARYHKNKQNPGVAAKLSERASDWARRNPDSPRRYRVENRDYISAKRKQRAERYKKMIPRPRSGKWTPAEDGIALRDDISVIEIACILQRSYTAVVAHRRHLKNRSSDGRRA
jgi:hypothetical protein